jgi:GNAT superfamily N-acetyltransferase
MSRGLELPSQTLPWGTDAAFSLRELMVALEAGQSPPPDCGITIVAEREWPGVFSFSQHHLIAADVDPAWIRAQLPPGSSQSRPMSGEFLAALGRQLGGRTSDGIAMMLYAPRLARPLPNMPPLVEVGADHHPRIIRSALYRRDVRAWTTAGGCMTLGRGVGGRWELSVEVDPEYRQRGLGLALLQAGQYLVEGEYLWAQIAVGNALLIRNSGRYGWTPAGAEALLY